MKQQWILSPLLVLLAAASTQAQKGDWQAVKNLAPGTLISVERHRHSVFHQRCRFEDATDEELVCRYSGPLFFPGDVTYRRSLIHAVRREHNTAAIGLGIGAATGAAIGAFHPGSGKGFFVTIDAGLLGLFGAGVGTAVGPLFPGKLVYLADDHKPAPPEPPRPALKIPQNDLRSRPEGFQATPIREMVAPNVSGDCGSRMQDRERVGPGPLAFSQCD